MPAHATPAFVVTEIDNPEPVAGAHFGSATAGLGDLDGDQVGEFAVASVRIGVVWILAGTDGAPLFRLTDPDDLIGTQCEPNADEPNPCNFGWVVANVHDIDGDGIDDFAIGAPGRLDGAIEPPCLRPPPPPPPPPGEDPPPPSDPPEEDKCDLFKHGRLIVYSGATGAVLRNIDHLPMTPPKFGVSIVGLGDVDGDGLPEISVGHLGNSNTGGAVTLISLSGDSGIIWWTVSPNFLGDFDAFSVYQADLGDLTGDGWPELLVTAFDEKVYVLSGASGDVVRLHEDPHEHDDLFEDSNFGARIGALGDLDGDALTEYVVAEPRESFSEGSLVHLFDGASGSVLDTLPSPVDGRGSSVSLVSTGDYDDDALPDLWAGSFSSSTAVLMTAAGASLATLDGPADSGFGGALSAVAPLASGPPDLLVSASSQAVAGLQGAGAVYVVRRDRPPDCTNAFVDQAVIWVPDLKFVPVTVNGVSDPEGGPIAITVTSIRQDEPVAPAAPDGFGVGTSTAWLRAQRDGSGDGRVYHVAFEAGDEAVGTCSGTVLVSVIHDLGRSTAVDGGPLYDSTAE